MCHLADCELVFSYRIRQTLAQDHHVIQPFDQEIWAANYAGYDPQAAMMTFSCVRQWNLMLLRSIPPEAMSKPVLHPERGEMTFRELIETMAGHDLNHLAQLGSNCRAGAHKPLSLAQRALSVKPKETAGPSTSLCYGRDGKGGVVTHFNHRSQLGSPPHPCHPDRSVAK